MDYIEVYHLHLHFHLHLHLWRNQQRWSGVDPRQVLDIKLLIRFHREPYQCGTLPLSGDDISRCFDQHRSKDLQAFIKHNSGDSHRGTVASDKGLFLSRVSSKGLRSHGGLIGMQPHPCVYFVSDRSTLTWPGASTDIVKAISGPIFKDSESSGGATFLTEPPADVARNTYTPVLSRLNADSHMDLPMIGWAAVFHHKRVSG